MQPAIKWSGSKRSQSKEILKEFPSEIDTYYEPFCGSCAVLGELLLRKDIKVKHYVASDINNDLINVWKDIKDSPDKLSKGYRELWMELNSVEKTLEDKKNYFYAIRDEFNKNPNSIMFLFLMRTTTNGMPRYNKEGKFNNSFHITRNGIEPNRLDRILSAWSSLLNEYEVEFRLCDYTCISSKNGDFVYLDPPYANTKGMYFGGIDTKVLFEWMGQQKSRYILSYDGKSGEVDNTYNVPISLYTEHKYICSGNSSFKRLIGKSKDSIVYESLYVK